MHETQNGKFQVKFKTSVFVASPFPPFSLLQFLLERPLRAVSPEKSTDKPHPCRDRGVQSVEKVGAYSPENTGVFNSTTTISNGWLFS